MSLELNCENLFIALLEEQAALSAFEITNYTEDAAQDIDRIVVQAMPEEPLVPAHRPSLPAKMSRVPIKATVRSMTLSAAEFDAIVVALKAAADSAPASVVATANGLFPNGFQIEDTEDGEYGHSDNVREWSKTWNAIVIR